MKKRSLLPVLLLCLLLVSPLFTATAQAAELDEILRYEITVDVNDDATLRMRYHIDWKVLDSTSEGPLSWVTIGIPNNHYLSMTALSPAVKEIRYASDGGSNVRVDLDREYHAGEVAQIEFEVVQDYMYQVDELTEGETVYRFTPGWFDDIRVDELTIRWNADRALSQTPACIQKNGYFTWSKALDKGEMFDVSVTYPNDAFAFDVSKSIETGDDWGGEWEDEDDGWAVFGGGVMIFLLIGFRVLIAIAGAAFDKDPGRGVCPAALRRHAEKGHAHQDRVLSHLPGLRRAASGGQGQLRVLRPQLHQERGGHQGGGHPRGGKGTEKEEHGRIVPLYVPAEYLRPRPRNARARAAQFFVLAGKQQPPFLLRAQLLRLCVRLCVRLRRRRPCGLLDQGLFQHRPQAASAFAKTPDGRRIKEETPWGIPTAFSVAWKAASCEDALRKSGGFRRFRRPPCPEGAL